MPGEVAQAFVRIRPDTRGFKQETESGVKNALVGIGKLAGGIFAARELEQGIHQVVAAAVAQQEELAVVRRAVSDNNAAWVVHGKTVDDVLRQQAVRFGFTVADLAQGFTRIEVGTRDTARSFQLLGLAEDISRARHLGLAQASVILTRAAQGNDVSLRRLGIVIPKLTEHVDALKRQHLEAAAAGVKFDAQSKISYGDALAQAKALDVQANKTRIVSELQQRFGGQSVAFAKTTAGSFASFKESLNEFEVALGDAFLPTLAATASGIAHEFQALANSATIHRVAAAGAHELAAGYHLIHDAIETLIPVLRPVAHLIAETTHVAGIGGILAFVAGFKTLAIAQSVSTGAQARYNSILAAGAGETRAAAAANLSETESMAALTAATVENTAALAAHAAANQAVAAAAAEASAASVSQIGSAVANTTASGIILPPGVLRGVKTEAEAAALGIGELATAETAATAATETFAFSVGGLGRGLFALAGGWTTLAAVGVGALAFGIYKLVTAESASERANDRLRDSLHQLDDAYQSSAKLAKSYAETISSIKTDRVSVQVSRTNVLLAEQAVAQSKLSHSSAQYQSLVAQLASAQDAYRISLRTLAQDEVRATDQRAAQAKREGEIAKARVTSIKNIRDLGRSITQEQQDIALQGSVALPKESIFFEAAARQREIEDFTSALRKNADTLASGNAQVRRQIQVLATFSQVLGHIPSVRQIRVALDATSAMGTVQSLLRELARLHPTAQGFVTELHREATELSSSNPIIARRLILLADYTRLIGHIPTRHDTSLVLNAPDFKSAVQALARVLGEMKGRAKTEGFASGVGFAQFFEQGELSRSGPLFAPIQAALRAAEAAVRRTHAAAISIKDVGKDELTAARSTEDAARRTVATLAQGVSQAAATVKQAEQGLADADRNLADTIRTGNQQVRDAIVSAQQNLFSIGSSLSDSINQFIDAQNKSTTALIKGSPQAKEFRRLKDEIAKGQGGDDLLRSSHALANQLEAQQARGSQDQEARKERIRREIADLIDEFNKGAITLQEFNRRIAALLAREHVSYRAAGRVLGIAFADGFRAEVRGLGAQALAIQQGPRGRRGQTGLEPTIVRPLEALRQTQRDIASAQRQRDDALLTVTKDEKALHQAENKHADAIETLTRTANRLDRLQEEHLAYLKEKARLEAINEENRHKRLMEEERHHTRLLQRIADEGRGQRKPPDAQPSGKRGDGERAKSALVNTMRGVAP